ncbi:MAG TPA: M1 family aminopeptidase [Longimicrobium sp.]|nr:M1 family aminopeptidase [Longimicrobium sp.]
MLREVIRFEWRYHTRQIAFPVAVLLFLGLGYLLPVSGYGPGGTHLNSPFVVMQSVGLLSLLTIFVLTVFCANSVSRDAEHGMMEIVHATSVGKLRYLGARFVGALAAAAAAFSFTLVGLVVAPMVAALDPARVGPTNAMAYLWALLVMALPNLLFAAAVVFAVAVLTRSVLASYVGSVFLYMLYMVIGMLTGSPLFAGAQPQTPRAMRWAAILDPFGISAFFQQTWYWTPAQRNTELLALDGYFLLNRVLVLAVSLAILAITYWRFSFRLSASAKPARVAAEEPRRAETATYRPVAVRPESRRARWAALRVLALREFRTTATSKPFLALLALWVSVAAIDIADDRTWEYHTHAYPTTSMMLDSIQVPLMVLATLMLVYFAAEVVWRERIAKADEIVDATPAPNGVFYLAKGAALILLTWLMTALPVVLAIGWQLSRGYTQMRPAAYLWLFFFAGAPLALFTVVILLVQTLTPNRYLGIVVGMVLGLLMLFPHEFGLVHGLTRFGNPNGAPFTEMNGYHHAEAFGWYMLYWSGLAGVLGLLALGLWRRGRAQTLLGRVRALPRRWGRRGLAGAAGSLALFLGTGGFIFHDTNVRQRYETREETLDWQEAYERAYRRFDGRPQPSVVAVKTEVDLHPAERRFEIAGSYRLENRTSKAIDTVLVSQPRDLPAERMELSGARLVRYDEAANLYLFALSTPLAPGASAELRFRTRSPRRRVVANSFDFDVVANGSYLTRQAAFPRVGYVRGHEIDGPYTRSQRGLGPPRPGVDSLEVALAGRERRESWLTMDATVSTAGDQIAIGPGDLVREWRQGGRRYFHYRTAAPTTPVFGFVSARYQVRRVNHKGVSVEVYHHPGHEYNLDRMIAAATRSLDVFGARFGPYPHRHLRIAELPAHWSFGAYAQSGMIVWPEDRGFLTRYQEGDVDLVTRRLAHEIAHQWWGHTLYPAQVEGAVTLVETMAKYSEMLVLEATQGKASIPPMLRYEREMYALSRMNMPFPEPTLLRAYTWDHVYYSKGSIVMEALRDLMGDDALNRALHRLVREHGGPHGRPATTLDLLAALRAEAAPEHHALIGEWLGSVTLYELRVESASARALPDGRHRVTATIRARKTVDPGGSVKPTEAPLDEAIDVAVYAQHPSRGNAQPIYAGKHRLRTGQAQITFEVRGRPAFVALDPFERRIEVERADNVREVSTRP